MKCRISGANASSGGVKLSGTNAQRAEKACTRAATKSPAVIPQSGLVSMRRMSSTVAALPYRESWLTRVRERNVFSGLGFATGWWMLI
jgi:hypothetical protein